jgi:hypothetical protein
MRELNIDIAVHFQFRRIPNFLLIGKSKAQPGIGAANDREFRGDGKGSRLSGPQEIVGIDVGLSENGAQCPLRQIAWMIGDGRVAVRLRIVPDFVAAGSVTMESESKAAQLLDRFRIFETG